MTKTTKFKDLGINQEFEFDHSSLSVDCLQFAHGPWRKISAHNYVESNSSSPPLQVGTINVEVLPGTHCGLQRRPMRPPTEPTEPITVTIVHSDDAIERFTAHATTLTSALRRFDYYAWHLAAAKRIIDNLTKRDDEPVQGGQMTKTNDELHFITLQTDSHTQHKVRISYKDNDKFCYLCGGLQHHTRFTRSDLIAFATSILEQLAMEETK